MMLNFKDLYENYAPDVYRFSLWMTGDRSDAEDITSETIVRAWARRSKIRTETLKAYLFAIARNIYLERLRNQRRQIDLDDLHSDPAPGPERIVETRLELLSVRQILLSIPEIDRAAFVMRFQHELPYAEIARVLGLSLTATKVKVHRVRKKLLVSILDKEVAK
jgi:RNA polymerase sigma-70 factor (ECF subfamily)